MYPPDPPGPLSRRERAQRAVEPLRSSPAPSVLEPLKPLVLREAAAVGPSLPNAGTAAPEEPLEALEALRSELSRVQGPLPAKSPALVALLDRCEELLRLRARGGAGAKMAETELDSTLEVIDAVMEGLLLGGPGGPRVEGTANPRASGEAPP